MLFYLAMVRPELEVDEGTPTPLGTAMALFPGSASRSRAGTCRRWPRCCPCWGFLMVSRVRYPHMVDRLTRRGSFFALVYVVVRRVPVLRRADPILFLAFNGFVLHA
jgi:hypothetical protein